MKSGVLSIKAWIFSVLAIVIPGIVPIYSQNILPVKEFQKTIAGSPYLYYGTLMAQGPDNSIYISAGSGGLFRLDAEGNQLWDIPVAPLSGFSGISGLAVDGDGNAYVSVTDYDNYQIAIAVYNRDGGFVRTLTPPKSQADLSPMATGVAFDRNLKKLYTSHVFLDPENNWKYTALIAVYTSTLELQTTKTLVLGDSFGEAAVSLDAAGNVYLGGYGNDSAEGARYVATKYSPGLILMNWTTTESIGAYYGRFFELFNKAQDNGGMVFWSMSQAGNALRRVSPDGAFLAGMDVNSQRGDETFALDAQGAVYLRAETEDYATGLVKINSANEYAWGSSLLVEPDNYVMQALVGKDYKIYVVGEDSSGYYLARYRQGGAKKYSISLIRPSEIQVVDIGNLTVPLVSQVKDDSNMAASGSKLTFSVSTYPAGAVGFSLTKSSEATDTNGFAELQFKLGNIPAEYGVTAECPSCVSEASSVTFRCCGKLRNDNYKQFDINWGTHPYNTQSASYKKNISTAGCSLTTLSTLINYYAISFPKLNISTTNPLALNDVLLNKTKVKGYDAFHNLKFEVVKDSAVSNGNLSLLQKLDFQVPLTSVNVKKLRREINDRLVGENPIIVKIYRSRINPKTNKKEQWTHFMLIVGKCGDNYIVSDPGSSTRIFINPEDATIVNEATQNTFGPVCGLRIFGKKE